jgi:predicted amidohydrolase
MRVRAVQFSPQLGNISNNLHFHKKKIKEALNDKMDLIIFPELSLSGYHLKDIVYDISLTPDHEILHNLMELSRDIDIVVGTPFEDPPGIVYNSALYFSKGEILHNHRKVYLPNFGMFQEEMIFKAGNQFKNFKVNGFTVGLVICREILFPINAYLYYLQHVDFLIGISNSPYRGIHDDGLASYRLWERVGEVYAINYHMNYVFVNRTGYEDGMGFGGGSFFAEPGKGIIKRAALFEEDYFDFEISKENVRRARIGGNYLRDEKPEVIFNELKRILDA